MEASRCTMNRELQSHRGDIKRTEDSSCNEAVTSQKDTKSRGGKKRKRPQKNRNGVTEKSETLTTSNLSSKSDQFPGFLSRKEHVELKNKQNKQPPKKRPVVRGKRRRNNQNATGAQRNEHNEQSHREKRVSKKSKIKTVPINQNKAVDSVAASEKCVLPWCSQYRHVPVGAEEAMIPVLLRWGKKEHGMICRQKPYRAHAIKRKCRATGMYLSQALSLRRHHIKLLNPHKKMYQLGLGNTDDINAAAAVFEKAVAQYLDKHGVQYQGEEEQKQAHIETLGEGAPMPPTPDFMMKESIYLKENGLAPYSINWLEAKMFYGASTIPHDEKSAVGRILLTARKYVKCYGPGAIVFSYGCGEKLARELYDLGVIALDAFPIDLRQVKLHQRGWCANKNGEILP